MTVMSFYFLYGGEYPSSVQFQVYNNSTLRYSAFRDHHRYYLPIQVSHHLLTLHAYSFIFIYCILLCRLLGWSVFVGYIALFAGWPLNSLIMQRAIKIQKGTATARDKRMAVVNELVGAVKFIKFFAWEGRWIDRALESRRKEIAWLIKGDISNSWFVVVCADLFVCLCGKVVSMR